MPKVSIIIPVYGVEQYIERCARSLFSQTLDGIEFIFIDDCTKDHSIEILHKVIDECYPLFNERNWVIKVEKMPINSGLPTVRKRGVQLASGEYIAHCDSDDWVDKDMYGLMYCKAKEENLDAVYCDHYECDGGHFLPVSTFPKHEIGKQEAFDSMFADNRGYHSIWSALYRASLYEKVFEYPQVNMGEDTALTAQLLFFSKKVGYVQQPLYYYFQRQGSIMQTISIEKQWNNARQMMKNQDLIIRFFQQQKLDEKYILYAKLTARFALEGLRNEQGFYEAWHNCYPEIGHRIICNKNIPMRLRAKFFLLDTGLHRWVYMIAKKLSKATQKT